MKIKAFYGTTQNTVKTQIWIAISVYVLVAVIKKRLNIDLSLYTILQILSVSLFEKVNILQLLTNSRDAIYNLKILTNCFFSTFNGTLLVLDNK